MSYLGYFSSYRLRSRLISIQTALHLKKGKFNSNLVLREMQEDARAFLGKVKKLFMAYLPDCGAPLLLLPQIPMCFIDVSKKLKDHLGRYYVTGIPGVIKLSIRTINN